MRKSKVLEKLRLNKMVSCFKTNITDARSAEIAAISGFDCIWFDQEHVGLDWPSLASNVWATKAHDVDSLVRVSRRGYNDYIKPLELDATGIMVPHVMNYEDAKNIIHMTRFFPLGMRPLDGGNMDGSYTFQKIGDYMTLANKERFIIFQIEDVEALKDLEKIASLDGFDMLFFGPGDFSQSLGEPGNWENPELLKAKELIPKIASKFGKFAGTVCSPKDYKNLENMGYNFLNLGSDVVGLKLYCQNLLESIK